MAYALATPSSCHLKSEQVPGIDSLHNLCTSPLSLRLIPAKPSSASRFSSFRRQKHLRRPQHFQFLVPRVNVDSVSSETEAAAEAPLSPEEEEDRDNVQQILQVLALLEKKRNMPFNEARLTIMIEDPREVERRNQIGVEDERGCSREDMAAALLDIHEGRMPSDRLVLRELTKEMLSWPTIEDKLDEQRDRSMSPYARATDTGVNPKVASQGAKVDWDAAAEIKPGNEDQNFVNVPPAAGFSVVYFVSIIPILIGIAVVSILFFNSFR